VRSWLETNDADAARPPAIDADIHYTQGWIWEARHNIDEAAAWYRRAIELNPYHRGARMRLIGILVARRQRPQARQEVTEARRLPLPLGPDFRREAEVLLSNR
jgi:tetratricopeptide (TPR) repeat protein